MIITAIGLFALAAMLGMMLLSFVLTGKETPKAVVFTHGPLAAAGLVLLIIYACRRGPGPIESIILFAMAAAGGVVMLGRDLTGKPIPRWLAIGHGVIAITGFILLLIFAINNPEDPI